MSRGSVLRAVVALAVAVACVGVTVSLAGPLLLGGGVGVLVGVPGAGVELARAIVPVLVGLLVAVLAIRFGIRALRKNATVASDLERGGKLLSTTAWAAFLWLLLELLYRQLWLGWATLFGSLGVSLVWSAATVALCVVGERLVPWSRAPRGLRHVGLLVVVAVTLLTAWSAWSHRHVVPRAALIPVALVGILLLASGVRRAERNAEARLVVELGLASLLLAGPLWSVVS
jgi:hypothetical protein